MGLKFSNPANSYLSSLGSIIKKPGDVGAWKDLGVNTATGGWAETDATEREKIAKREKEEKRAADRAISFGKQEGYDEARQFYGVGREELAPKVRGIGEKLESRVDQSGADPVSAAIMGQAATSKANAARQLAQSGVKGGAAIGAMESVGRAKDAEIRASLYGQQKQSIDDYRNYLGNIISGSKAMAYDTAALRSPTPTPPQQRSMWDDILGRSV